MHRHGRIARQFKLGQDDGQDSYGGGVHKGESARAAISYRGLQGPRERAADEDEVLAHAALLLLVDLPKIALLARLLRGAAGELRAAERCRGMRL